MIDVKIFGSGCSKCEQLYQDCLTLAAELGLSCNIEKINDQEEFYKQGVFLTPSLMINGKLMTSGKVPMAATLRNWMKNASEEKI
jgi:small redox-active disulfide protein 2